MPRRGTSRVRQGLTSIDDPVVALVPAQALDARGGTSLGWQPSRTGIFLLLHCFSSGAILDRINPLVIPQRAAKGGLCPGDTSVPTSNQLNCHRNPLGEPAASPGPTLEDRVAALPSACGRRRRAAGSGEEVLRAGIRPCTERADLLRRVLIEEKKLAKRSGELTSDVTRGWQIEIEDAGLGKGAASIFCSTDRRSAVCRAVSFRTSCSMERWFRLACDFGPRTTLGNALLMSGSA